MPENIEPLDDLYAPFEEISMVLVPDDSSKGQRPLSERERIQRAASWGYRQAVIDQLSLEGIEPLDQLKVFRWFCACILQNCTSKDQIIGYQINSKAHDNV